MTYAAVLIGAFLVGVALASGSSVAMFLAVFVFLAAALGA